jgi:hypothetical protein
MKMTNGHVNDRVRDLEQQLKSAMQIADGNWSDSLQARRRAAKLNQQIEHLKDHYPRWFDSTRRDEVFRVA